MPPAGTSRAELRSLIEDCRTKLAACQAEPLPVPPPPPPPLPPPSPPPPTGLPVYVYDSLTTIRADQSLPPGSSSSVSISAAGNEFESFQLVVQAGSSSISGVNISVDLPVANVTIYREANIQITTPTNNGGPTGSWPDALIPKVDGFYGETRNAFPIDLAAGKRVTAWVDVLVPNGALAGSYTGTVTVRGNGGTVATAPITLTVRAFSIPSTSTLRSAFGIGGVSLPGGDQSLYVAAGLNNRTSVSQLWPFPSSREALLLPLVQGSTAPGVKLPGAKLTAINPYACGSGCLESWRDLAQRHPEFGSIFFGYICDEPGAGGIASCTSIANSAESVWPGSRKLLTTDIAHVPSWTTDLSPLINDMVRDGNSAYTNWHSGTRGLWPYNSCRSYGCSGDTWSSYEPWAGYSIDVGPPSLQRAMSWLCYQVGATGELYYNTTQVSDTSAWTDQYRSGGNGDGTLFYPGTPSVIGGTTPIPIESMRLKRIRDGREDYEYLHLATQRGRGAQAMSIAQGLFPAWNQCAATPTAVATARTNLAALIS